MKNAYSKCTKILNPQTVSYQSVPNVNVAVVTNGSSEIIDDKQGVLLNFSCSNHKYTVQLGVGVCCALIGSNVADNGVGGIPVDAFVKNVEIPSNVNHTTIQYCMDNTFMLVNQHTRNENDIPTVVVFDTIISKQLLINIQKVFEMTYSNYLELCKDGE